ncbi:MAG: energy transducer TonB [Cellvibrionaceae bacterium]|nr:energy transducer TonB [Cellvibrionaceae bacterium]
MIKPYFSIVISLVLLAPLNPALASDAEISDYRYNKAKLVKQVKPTYPQMELKQFREGWVRYSVIVDEQGNVQQPILLHSSGNKAFQRRAEAAIKKFKYQPATLNGKAVESSDNQVHISFNLVNPIKRANSRFYRHFKRAKNLIKDQALEQARKKIETLEDKHTFNRYEQAFLALLKSHYHASLGDPEMQLHYLRRATLYQKDSLPRNTYANALAIKYQLEVERQSYRDAFETAALLEGQRRKSADHQQVLAHRDKLRRALKKQPSFSFDGSIKNEHPWHHSLMRKQFSLASSEGKLKSLEIRCDNKIRRFELDNNAKTWNIPANWGSCDIFVWGDTGSKFYITEALSAEQSNAI